MILFKDSLKNRYYFISSLMFLNFVIILVYFPGNRTFELHSPDGVHSCILRASDVNEAASWFNSLHSALYVLTMKALQEANKGLSPTLMGGELHHIGWLSARKQRLNYGIEVCWSKFDVCLLTSIVHANLFYDLVT